MSIKMIAASAALAVALTSGSAFAAEQFNTLDGIAAAPMTADEMAAVVGSELRIFIGLPDGVTFVGPGTVGKTNKSFSDPPQLNFTTPGGTCLFVSTLASSIC